MPANPTACNAKHTLEATRSQPGGGGGAGAQPQAQPKPHSPLGKTPQNRMHHRMSDPSTTLATPQNKLQANVQKTGPQHARHTTTTRYTIPHARQAPNQFGSSKTFQNSK